MHKILLVMFIVLFTANSAFCSMFEDALEMAEDGDAGAQTALASMYSTGSGVPQNDVQAVYWFKKAAEQGHDFAQFNLGYMYETGQGVSQDYKQAVYWYTKAAKQGNAMAQSMLGNMYFDGQGVAQDYKKAVYWFNKAAKQGYAMAQGNLGVMYSNGQGVTQNFKLAYVWFNLAAAQGHDEDAIKNRDEIASMLTPQQRSEAQDLAVKIQYQIDNRTESKRGNSEDLNLKSADLKPTSEPAESQASIQRAGNVWREPVTGMEFVWMSGGCFMMGQTDSEKNYLIQDAGHKTYDKYFKQEMPRHEVCVDGFWIGKTEVTRGQFRSFFSKEGYKTDADKQGRASAWNGGWQKESGANWEKTGYSQTDSHPVVNVSWNDAKAFIKWLSGETGQKFTLPTEAQWEYAARGGTKEMRFWGNNDNDADACKYANVADKGNWDPNFPCSDGYKFTAPVANYSANPFGLYDMLGNVWEWCEDVYDSNAYSKHARNNPVVTSGGTNRVVRGGGWYISPRVMRVAFRDSFAPDLQYINLGFRLSLPQIRQ